MAILNKSNDSLNTHQRKQFNDFVRDYVDINYRHDINRVRIISSDSYEHNLMIFEICYWLKKQGIPFMTQVRFKTGYRPDIVIPVGHIKQIIEVRHTEDWKKTESKLKLIPKELKEEIIYVKAQQNFNEKLIL